MLIVVQHSFRQRIASLRRLISKHPLYDGWLRHGHNRSRLNPWISTFTHGGIYMTLLVRIGLIVAIAASLQSCAWFKGLASTELNQEDLAELFTYREVALDQAKLLKGKVGPSIPEADVRAKYQAVQTSFNSTLTVLQTSITAGNDPGSYQKALRSQLDTIKSKTDDLSKYTREKTGATSRPVVSEVVVGIAKGVVEIWKGYREALRENREAVTKQLQQQRMPAFEQI
jgi:hypothetical protein